MLEEPATPATGATLEVVEALLFLSVHCANTSTVANAKNPF